jgi:hypothetical protein
MREGNTKHREKSASQDLVANGDVFTTWVLFLEISLLVHLKRQNGRFFYCKRQHARIADCEYAGACDHEVM